MHGYYTRGQYTRGYYTRGWLLHAWLAITRVAGYYTRGWLLHAALIFKGQGVLGCTFINREKTGRYTYERLAHCVCTYYVVSFIFSATVRQFLAWTMDL